MTRGTLAIIWQNKILTSTEYNGEMYLDKGSWGTKAFNLMKRESVYDDRSFKGAVNKFTKDYGYTEECDFKLYELDMKCLDMNHDYFDHWFSDYVFLKNLTAVPQYVITDEDKKPSLRVKLNPMDVLVLNFGSKKRLYKHTG